MDETVDKSYAGCAAIRSLSRSLKVWLLRLDAADALPNNVGKSLVDFEAKLVFCFALFALPLVDALAIDILDAAGGGTR